MTHFAFCPRRRKYEVQYQQPKKYSRPCINHKQSVVERKEGNSKYNPKEKKKNKKK